MLTSSCVGDEDNFRQRLDSINKEMQAIIERTGIEHDRLLRNSPTVLLPWNITDGVSVEGVEPFTLLRTSTTSRVTLDEAAVRRIVANEMNMWKGTLQEMLSQALGGVTTAVRQHLEGISKYMTELAELLRESTESSRRGMSEVQSALNQIQRNTSRSVENLAKELGEYVNKSTLEQTHLRDTVSALKNEARIDQQRGDRRVDELVHRHHDLVRNSLLELDAHVGGLRDELHATVRQQARQVSEEQNAIQQHVARLQGALEATNDTTVKWVAELRNLMEENITCQSEIRSCRRNFDRLEMLLQEISDGGVDASAISRGKGNFRRGESDGVSSGVKVSYGEFVVLKERVKSVESTTERVSQQVASMDKALRSLFTGNGGLDDLSFMIQNTCKEATGKMQNSSESLARGGVASAIHPQLSQRFPTETVQEQQQMMTKAVHGQQGSNTVTRTREGSHSQALSKNLTGSSPVSSRSWNVHSTNDDSKIHKQQQPKLNAQGGYLRSYALDSSVSSGNAMTHPAASPTKDPHRSAGAPYTQYETAPSVELDLLVPERKATNSTLSTSKSPVHLKASTRSNSYVSENDEEWRNNNRSTQYVPAPSSDIESELDNKKMARLALD